MTNSHTADAEARFRAMFERSFGKTDTSAFELFRSLMKSYHILNSATERHIAKHDLSTAKMRILFWLKMRAEEGIDGGGLLPSELSRFQGVAPNTMSSLLTSLREAGLIEQVSHPADRRKHVIKITLAGLDLIQKVGPEHQQYIRDLFSGLSEEECQILITLLHKLNLSVKARARCEAPEHAPE